MSRWLIEAGEADVSLNNAVSFVVQFTEYGVFTQNLLKKKNHEFFSKVLNMGKIKKCWAMNSINKS